MKVVPTTKATSNFGGVLKAIAAEPVQIVKSGKPVAVVITAKLFDAMGRGYALTMARSKLAEKEPHVVRTLVAFSRAEISSEKAAEKLALKDRGQLLDLLGMTSLPFPSIPAERIASMVDRLVRKT